MTWTDRFAGRTAIVTGGASGLGKAVAARIVAEGGKVLLWDVDATALHAVREELGEAHVRAVDVSDQVAVVSATAEAGVSERVDFEVATADSFSGSGFDSAE